MRLLSRVASLLRNTTHKDDVERDLREEVNSYVELLTQEKIRDGITEGAARRAALVELGGAEQVKEQVREIRMGHFLEMRGQDVRYAARTLRKSPVYSITVALVLGLGIGSTALMFTIVNSVLLKGPPFPESDRLVMLWQDLPQEKHVSFSAREFIIWQSETRVFETLSAFTGNGFTITGRGEPELAIGRQVTPSFFQTLRAAPALGRTFLEDEGTAGRDRSVILSHALWRDKFAMRADVIGQPVVMNGEPYTVVGVMPESFLFLDRETKLWVPAALDAATFQQHFDAHMLRVIGRLKPGVSTQQLQAEIDVLGTRVNAPEDDTVRRFYAIDLKEIVAGELRQPLLVLLAAVAFLLLIACANVANLMLARASAREPEMAIRSALGASRRRLVLQLLTEAALLACLGGMLGTGIAIWGLDLLKLFAARNLPELATARLDGTALAFILAATTTAGVLFGLGPAFATSRTSYLATLKGAARTTAASGAERTRQVLVFVEVALASLLLIGCALMMRSFVALVHADPGFRTANVITADAVLMKDRYPDAPALLQFYRESIAAIRALPAIDAAGMVTHLPFGGNSWGNSYEVEQQPAPAGVQYNAQIRPVSPGYLAALEIPLQRGRDVSEQDNEKAPGVAIVNQIFADRFWPNADAVGQRIRYGRSWLSIVGVCGAIKHSRLETDADAEIYVPYPQVDAAVMQFVGRNLNYVVHSASPALVAPQLRATLRQLDPGLVVRVNTMDALINDSIAQPRFRTWLIGIVSAFALALACIGIYGVIAYLVTQRSKEFGIRIALGATRGNILRLVLGRTLRLTAAGVAAGVVAAFFLSRFLGTILFGISVHDALAFIAVPTCLIAVALLAGFLPARRATHVDPVTSLRYE
ncbi:MAG: ABC transporter permease [Chthoniobacterales bacterium]|nr:ABC transporter permease [Chthoniobacterales bacterium]